MNEVKNKCDKGDEMNEDSERDEHDDDPIASDFPFVRISTAFIGSSPTGNFLTAFSGPRMDFRLQLERSIDQLDRGFRVQIICIGIGSRFSNSQLR